MKRGFHLAVVLGFVAFAAGSWPSSACAARIRGQVPDPSPEARYAIWVVTDLDLTAPDQPAAIVPVDEAGRFDAEVPAADGPHQLMLHQRFQHMDGPPVDLFMPASLLPRQGAVDLRITGVDPRLLMDRRKFAPTADVLTKWGTAWLVVLGGGLLLRRRLAPWSAPEGRRSAPLGDAERPASPDRREWLAVSALFAIALLLRSRGFASESLDLLEASYLPGIGRPSDFVGRASGLSAVPQLVREVLALWCLDLTHPPAYHALMGVMGLLGTSVVLLRLPGLAASLITGWLMWKLLRRFSVPSGLLALGVFAVASPAIYFGQDATPYAAVGLAGLASAALLVRALETGRTGPWWAFFTVLVVGFYAHYNVALLGMAELALLLGLVGWGWWRGDKRWPAALHRALGPATALAPLPLLWLWPHFSTFEPVAQNTRLVADTYAPDPGLLSYAWDFFKVTAGVPADGPGWPALAAAPLVLLGAWRGLSSSDPTRRALGLLLAGLAVGFFASVAFFYFNVIEALGGKVFYGFRWVGWAHPLMLCIIALGAAAGPGPALLRGAAFAAWMVGVLPGTADLWRNAARPNYEDAVSFIRSELQDRDAIATLPAWFQRGNLSHYLFQQTTPGRLPQQGEGVWVVDGKRLTLEAIHPALPFETTASSSHYDRLWVAVVEEQMSGRAKFSPQVADQALVWAREHLEFDGHWRLDRIELYRFVVPKEDLTLRPGRELRFSAGETLLNFRTYPRVTGPIRNMRPRADIAPLSRLGPTVRYHAPTTPGCVDWELSGLDAALVSTASNHWYLELRVPLPDGAPDPAVEPLGPAQVHTERMDGDFRISAVGLPCSEPPLELLVRWPDAGEARDLVP